MNNNTGLNNTARGNLDLIIARMARLKARERAALCKAFAAEDDFLRCSPSDRCFYAEGQREFNFAFDSRLIDEARRLARKDRILMEARGIDYVSIAEDAYPELLREIYDPPAVLYYKGAFPLPKILAAVVGTRKPEAAALEVVYTLSRALGEAGVCVVSGLALGIDAMAHRGNLEGGGCTAAVLGSAVDMVFPASNRSLARRILSTGGTIVSEYPPGTPPLKWNFPERNRIISGLSLAVIVASAPRKSGALITADFALEQNRDLFVAASGGVPFGDGCRKLAEEGATLVLSADDILMALNINPKEKRGQEAEALSLSGALARELGLPADSAE